MKQEVKFMNAVDDRTDRYVDRVVATCDKLKGLLDDLYDAFDGSGPKDAKNRAILKQAYQHNAEVYSIVRKVGNNAS